MLDVRPKLLNMIMMKNLPMVSKTLLNKLIIARDIYQEFTSRLTDDFLKVIMKRIMIEKRIFVKDFNSINRFNLNNYMQTYEKDIKIEHDHFRNKMLFLMSQHDEQKILEFILKKEDELIKLYYMFLRAPVDDEFIRIIIKNQLDETRQSVRELNDLIVTYQTD